MTYLVGYPHAGYGAGWTIGERGWGNGRGNGGWVGGGGSGAGPCSPDVHGYGWGSSHGTVRRLT